MLWQAIVTRKHLRVGAAKMLGESLYDVNRAMLAAGTAHRDGQIAAVRQGKLLQAPFQEFRQVGHHGADTGMGGQKVDDGGIAAGQVAQ